MAQLRIRKKEVQVDRPASHLVPIALVLAAGIATTVLMDNGTQSPTAVAQAALSWVVATGESAHMAYVRTQSFTVKGRTWVLAEYPTITDFTPDELVPMGQANGRDLVANRNRGVTELSTSAKAYDRLYVELGQGRYGALRWRDVPR